MQLSEAEIELFYRLYYPLLVYTNQKFGIFPGVYASEDIAGLTLEELDELRWQLYNHPYLFELFVEENPLKFSASHLQTIASWKNFVKGKFYIYSYLKERAIFISSRQPHKVYGVLALDTAFSELLGSALPVMTETVLLPFNNKIIYDGTLQSYPFFFGLSIKGSLTETYEKAIAKFGIISSLADVQELKPEMPGQIETPDPAIAQMSDRDRLLFYLETQNNREKYASQIQTAIEENDELKILYYQEMGKLYAETYRDRWLEIGIKKGWIALFEEMPVASGATKAELEAIVKKLVPADKRKFVYIFRLKPNGK